MLTLEDMDALEADSCQACGAPPTVQDPYWRNHCGDALRCYDCGAHYSDMPDTSSVRKTYEAEADLTWG